MVHTLLILFKKVKCKKVFDIFYYLNFKHFDKNYFVFKVVPPKERKKISKTNEKNAFTNQYLHFYESSEHFIKFLFFYSERFHCESNVL